MRLKFVELPWAIRETGRHISLNTDIGKNIKVVLTQLCDLAGLMISFPLIMFLWRSFYHSKKVLHSSQPRSYGLPAKVWQRLFPIQHAGGELPAEPDLQDNRLLLPFLPPRWLSSDGNGSFFPSVHCPLCLPPTTTIQHCHSSGGSGGSFRAPFIYNSTTRSRKYLMKVRERSERKDHIWKINKHPSPWELF